MERTDGFPVDHGRDPNPGGISKLEERKLNEKYKNGREGGHVGKDFELDDNMQQLPNSHNNAHKIEKQGSANS